LDVEGTIFVIEFERPRWRRVEVPGKLAVPWRGRRLYRIGITSPGGFRPSASGNGEVRGADTRYLGCRVAISKSE
jgi:hypothetical protein